MVEEREPKEEEPESTGEQLELPVEGQGPTGGEQEPVVEPQEPRTEQAEVETELTTEASSRGGNCVAEELASVVAMVPAANIVVIVPPPLAGRKRRRESEPMPQRSRFDVWRSTLSPADCTRKRTKKHVSRYFNEESAKHTLEVVLPSRPKANEDQTM
ncbi:hypothetical protein FS749_008055 [Ceratobasidium sp. UAMH 11750]|nr:hypothetical protein FS749_008055 [Ceratobasidium sp. UAMH 11750]